MRRAGAGCAAERSRCCCCWRRAGLRRGAARGDPLAVGVLLSYSGSLAANSINSERALLMAFEAANAAGGMGGRQVTILARDTGSEASKVLAPAQELLEPPAPPSSSGPTPPTWRSRSSRCSASTR